MPSDGVALPGNLALPATPIGAAVFAHGSGSSRLSPRNLQVAEVLGAAGLATLLFDLLTEDEALDRANVFDIALLARRLRAASRWLRRRQRQSSGGLLRRQHRCGGGTLGSVRGRRRCPRNRVSWGRPDLAAPRLSLVPAPTLLIVGGADEIVLQLNQRALADLRCERELVVVPGATHLFEEAGGLERVAELATDWFVRYLPQPVAAA